MTKTYKSKNKKALKIHEETNDKLSGLLVDFKRELFNLRFQKTMGELKNSSRFSVVRKNIARIKTELTKRSKTESK